MKYEKDAFSAYIAPRNSSRRTYPHVGSKRQVPGNRYDLRAYATADARLLWEVDTARDYPTVNGVPAHGGAMDGPGATIVDGMLYVASGYAQWNGLAGNVLLAFEVRNP
jgi:hypothetical protein